MTLLLDGRPVSKKIREWVSDSVAAFKAEEGWVPRMVTVRIGDDPAAERYMRSQIRACKEVGIEAGPVCFEANTTKEIFLKELAALDRAPEIDGIILQTPFPAGWPAEEVLNALPSAKDAEGVHPENLGRLYLGERNIPLPCTAWAAVSLLEWYGRASLEGSRCAVIGRSPNVGRAIALMLMHRQATVTVCHTRTSRRQMEDVLSSSDLIAVAVGSAGIIEPGALSRHAWVIDVGTNVTAEGKLVGDVAPGAEGLVEALSPVPGGVGPVTVALLLANIVLCASRRRLGKSIMLPDLKKLREE